MKIAPLSHQFGRRLEEIDHQIDTCLRAIRRNLAELDQAARKGGGTDSPPAADIFADVLEKAVGDAPTGDPDATGDTG